MTNEEKCEEKTKQHIVLQNKKERKTFSKKKKELLIVNFRLKDKSVLFLF